jgi:hypothetical protein
MSEVHDPTYSTSKGTVDKTQEYVARVNPHAKHGDWLGKFVPAPKDKSGRARAIDTAHRDLGRVMDKHKAGLA